MIENSAFRYSIRNDVLKINTMAFISRLIQSLPPILSERRLHAIDITNQYDLGTQIAIPGEVAEVIQ